MGVTKQLMLEEMEKEAKEQEREENSTPLGKDYNDAEEDDIDEDAIDEDEWELNRIIAIQDDPEYWADKKSEVQLGNRPR